MSASKGENNFQDACDAPIAANEDKLVNLALSRQPPTLGGNELGLISQVGNGMATPRWKVPLEMYFQATSLEESLCSLEFRGMVGTN